MAVRTWQGGNTAVAQVWKGTITTTTGGHTYIVTLTDSNGDTSALTYVLTGSEGSVTAVAAAFIAAWNASVDARIAAITATQSSGQVILTADSAGVPFTATTSGTGTWSGTGNTTANAGPLDYNDPANWVERAVPVAADDVIIQGAYAIKYNANQSSVALGNVNFQNSSGAHGNPSAPLRLNCTGLNYSCTGVSYLNLGSSTVAPRVTQTASAATDAYGLYLLGTGMTTLRVEGSSIVGVCVNAGQVSTVATIQTSGSARTMIGSGGTLTTFRHDGGTSTVNCAATTINASAGTLTTNGSGAVTTINNNGATIIPNSTGTITTLTNNTGTTDFTKSTVSRTVTNATINGGTILSDPGVITYTNKLTIGARLRITATTI